jgi:5-oxoprolinase (ATP-hydrolysing)
MARTGASAGFKRIIGFDMGGTSTDVAHFDGEFERAFETEVAGVRMRAPMMKIHTVAAGGGSILSFDGARFRVGPASAGADPGPAAYRRGGPLTVTDANLMTGKLIPDLFPKVFGPRSDEPLDDRIVRERFQALARDIGDGRSEEAVADGFLAIAVAKMAEAIKTISVARGYDVTRYALNCFGGAGGQHACDVADALAISTVLIHPFSSLLSAYGMGLADIAAQRAQGVDEPLRVDALLRVNAVADRLAVAAVAEVEGQGVAPAAIKVHRRAQLRYSGSDTTIEVRLSTPAAMRRAFESAHKSRFGFIDRDKAIAIEAVSVEAVGGAARLAERTSLPAPVDAVADRVGRDQRSRLQPVAARATRFFSHGSWRKANVFLRDALAVGAAIDGPALVIEPHQTIVVEHGWRAEITAKNHVLMTRVEPMPKREAIGSKADPVMLEIFNHLFMSIAEQMGVTLQNTAYSVNIKASSPMRRICRCIWARWIARSSRSSATTRGASGLATCSPSTRPTMAARTCPTSPCARRSSTRRPRRSCSGSPRAAITLISAGPLPARCRRSPHRSMRRASISTIFCWSTAAASASANSTRF